MLLHCANVKHLHRGRHRAQLTLDTHCLLTETQRGIALAETSLAAILISCNNKKQKRIPFSSSKTKSKPEVEFTSQYNSSTLDFAIFYTFPHAKFYFQLSHGDSLNNI